MLKFVGYIDAGSGSYLLTAIASGAAGLWFFVRSKFGSTKNRSNRAETPRDADSDA